jgi:hypothetical protein
VFHVLPVVSTPLKVQLLTLKPCTWYSDVPEASNTFGTLVVGQLLMLTFPKLIGWGSASRRKIGAPAHRHDSSRRCGYALPDRIVRVPIRAQSRATDRPQARPPAAGRPEAAP